MEVLDKVRKLIELANHNPNNFEALAAAAKAVQLIEEHSLLQDERPIPQSARAWKPDVEFDEVVAAMNRQSPDLQGPTFKYPDMDIDDDFMRKRVKEAWGRIREERARLQAEIHNYEIQTRRRFNHHDGT